MSNKTIGFIGLGNMGAPMAENLLKNGYTVYGYDINEEALNTFADKGGNSCPTVKQAVENADVLFVSLPSPPIVRDVYLGEDGILAHAPKNLLIADTSTVSSELNRELGEACKEKNVRYLGAPVSGGVIGAVNATLTFMVGGPKQDYEEVRPVLDVLGGNLFYLGEGYDSGTVIKLINNLMIGFYTEAVGEALTLGENMGLDRQTMYDILNVSYGQSKIYDRNYKEYMANEDYEPGFSTNLLLKDLKLAQQMAEESGTQLPIGDKLVDWYSTVADNGYGHNDMSAVYLYLQKLGQKQKQ
ncbi:NAD(P)-dependent oxidoreductase [Alteribacillus iranensis]|uniref:3-hydroxyisobutyrate dehydrogenase n=1 Tax=Alteribacillus iranensis TaxID=930128 RepID=A0A1I2B7P0_9BACI|nr:NAD(P)-dependent oxidoreductase [Alteribacillus iranensis]SFE52017.1 3-hydroxyisobutyrate dehydrogenase [Alteribacillus iranensis]